MPVTFPAHAAAILPLLAATPRPLHRTALIVGAVAPDLAYAFGSVDRTAHEPLGLLTRCLPWGVAMVCWLELLILPVLQRTLPTLAGRLDLRRFALGAGLPRRPAEVAGALIGVLLGAATHQL